LYLLKNIRAKKFLLNKYFTFGGGLPLTQQSNLTPMPS
jgi:hypothetical protein